MQYKLTITIDAAKVQQLNTGNYALCFALGVSGAGEPTMMNVVASTLTGFEVSVVITWETIYAIAASSTTFTAGATFSTSSSIMDIDSQQVYTLPTTWSPNTVTTASNCPAGSFKFKNAIDASPVVFQQVNGVMVPVWISPTPDVPGTDTMTPVATCAVWFARATSSGTMVSLDQSITEVVEYKGVQVHSITYDALGHWSLT